jgi:hypothetical protein
MLDCNAAPGASRTLTIGAEMILTKSGTNKLLTANIAADARKSFLMLRE